MTSGKMSHEYSWGERSENTRCLLVILRSSWDAYGKVQARPHSSHFCAFSGHYYCITYFNFTEAKSARKRNQNISSSIDCNFKGHCNDYFLPKKKKTPVNRQENCDVEKLSFFANPVLLLITWSSNPAIFLKASLTKIQLLWNSQECGSYHKKIPVWT